MSNVIISKLNGYRFVPKDLLELDPMYNTYEFDLVYYSHQIKDWEQNVYYAQTVQFSDPLSLQVLARTGGQIEIRLYDCEGKRYKVSPFPILMTTPANAPTVSVGGNNKVYHAFYDEDFWEDLDANTYYLELRYNNQQLGITEVYVSEPIELRKLHKYTKLISYKNRYNKDFALFEQYNRRFYLRVPADLSLNIQGEKTVFTDGNNQSHLLVGSAIRVWDLTIGGQGKHIPAYLVDILNHIFHLDNIFIDNKRYTILEDSDLAMDTINLYPLKVLNITLGEVDDNLMSSTSTGVADPPTIIEVGELPSDPDSVILPPGLNLGDLGNISIPAPPFLSNSSTSTISGWLSNLNNLISTNYGIEGEFTIVGDTIFFNQPDDIPKGENAVYSIEFNVLSSMLVISGGITDTFPFDIDIGVNEFIVITNNVNAEDESLVYYNMNTGRGSISVDASANSYKIYVKKDIESIIIENIEIIGDLVIESTDNALENIITFIVRNSSHDNFSLDIKSNSKYFEMLDISNMSNTNNINIDMVRSLEFKNILLPSTGISSKIFNDIVELVHSNGIDVYLKEGKKIVYGVLDARGNGLFFDSLSQGIKDKIIQLREEGFWSIELGTLNALNLGGFYIKENGMIEIKAINLCGDYYTVTDSNGEVIEFNDIEAVMSYLNGPFSKQASLIGIFSLNENNEIIYSNEEDFCEHSFIEFVVDHSGGLRPLILTYDTSLYTDAIIELPNVGTDRKDIVVKDSLGVVVKSLNNNTDNRVLITDLPAGIYDVEVSMPETSRMDFNTYTNERVRETLVELKQWGDVVWGTELDYLFWNCRNLMITADDLMKMTAVGVIDRVMNLAFREIAGIINMGWVEALPIYTMTNIAGLFYSSNGVKDVVLDFNNASHLANINNMFIGIAGEVGYASIIIKNMGSTLTATGNILNTGSIPTLHTLIYDDLQLSQNISGFTNGTAQAYIDFFENIGDRTGKDQRTITMRKQDWDKLDAGQQAYVNQLMLDKNWAIAY